MGCLQSIIPSMTRNKPGINEVVTLPDGSQVKRLWLRDGKYKDVPIAGEAVGQGIPVEVVEAKKKREREKLLSADGRTQAANMRRSQFINLISQGYKADQACRELEIMMSTYYQWRTTFPGFKQQVDMARRNWYNTINGEQLTTWKDFSAFRKRFFRMNTYYVHAMIIDAIESADPMSVTLILVAPEVGKTTLLEDKICEILGKHPDRRCAYISESSGHSVKVGSRIRRRMTDKVEFGDYIAQFGPFYEDGQERNGKPWTTNFFTVYKAAHDERDYSFEARGNTSRIQGSRVDDMFLDDIQSIQSLDLTKKIMDKFRQDWITRVGRSGRIYIIGNRVGKGDVYESMIDSGLIDRLVEIPILDEEGNSCIPELWDNESLKKRRKQVGEEVWARTYMQEPQDVKAMTFPPEVREMFKDQNRVVKKYDNLQTAMSLDPAISGGCSLTVGQYNFSKLLLTDQETIYNVGSTEGILQLVERKARAWKPDILIIEAMAFQKAIAGDERMIAISRKYGFAIVPHTTGQNKHDENFGVASMATSIRAGEFSIPWGSEEAEAMFQPLLDEMEKWKPHVRGTKLRMDRIMSMWFLHLYWLGIRNVIEFEKKKDSFKRQGLPWRPTSLRSAH